MREAALIELLDGMDQYDKMSSTTIANSVKESVKPANISPTLSERLTEEFEVFMRRRRRTNPDEIQMCVPCVYGMHHVCASQNCSCVHRELCVIRIIETLASSLVGGQAKQA